MGGPAISATDIPWGIQADALEGEPARHVEDSLPELDESSPAPPFVDPSRYRSALEQARIRDAVHRQVKAEQRAVAKPIQIRTLRDRLRDAPAAVEWLIPGWHPAGGRVLVVAKGKGGKSTLVSNLVRSLVDGDPFLGDAAVAPVDGQVILVDTEMTEGQGTLWLRDQGIRADDRLSIIYLRGNVAAFDLLDPEAVRSWAARLKALRCRHLIIDPLKPLMDVFGLDENSEAGRLLVQIDALLEAAEIPSATLVHHMGWTAERARGSSRLLDWPDVTWTLNIKTDDPAGARFLSAYGRDVDQPERQLEYGEGRKLRFAASAHSSRRDVDLAKILKQIAEHLGALDSPQQLSQRSLEHAFSGADFGREKLRAALTYGVQAGALIRTPGPRGATFYSLTEPSARECADDDRRSTAPVRGSLIEAAHSRTELLAGNSPARGEVFPFDADPVGRGPEQADEEVDL